MVAATPEYDECLLLLGEGNLLMQWYSMFRCGASCLALMGGLNILWKDVLARSRFTAMLGLWKYAKALVLYCSSPSDESRLVNHNVEVHVLYNVLFEKLSK